MQKTQNLLLIFLMLIFSYQLNAQTPVLYTISGCTTCRDMIEILKKSQTVFIQKNISEDESYRIEMLDKLRADNQWQGGAIQMPVFERQKEFFVGEKAVRVIMESAAKQSNAVILYDEEPADMKGITEAHNVYRKELGIPPLKWSNALAAYSQEWANVLIKEYKGDLVHRSEVNRDPKQLGENLYSHSWTGSKPSEFASASVAAKSWGEEKQYFDPSKLSGDCCDGGACGHYTQMIWQNTTEVGCAKASAVIDGWNVEVYVCNYNPPGNYTGEKVYGGGGQSNQNTTNTNTDGYTLSFKNSKVKPVSVAIAYKNSQGKWVSQGWFDMATEQKISFPALTNDAEVYYCVRTDNVGTILGGEDAQFLIHPKNDFETGSMETQKIPMGYQLKGFKKLVMPSKDHTVNL